MTTLPACRSFPSWRRRPAAGLLCVLLLGTAGAARAQSRRYDTFTGPRLSPILWRGHPIGLGVLETVRQSQDGALVLSHQVLGNHRLSEGHNASRNRLAFQTGPGQNLTALRFRLQIEDVAVVGCPDGPPSRSYAGFTGSLFIDTGGDPVGVWLFAERRSTADEPPAVLHVRAGIFRCPDGDCATVAHDADEDLGPVQVGEAVTLRMAWQGREVRFRRDAEPPVTVRFRRPVARLVPGRFLEILGEAGELSERSADGSGHHGADR